MSRVIEYVTEEVERQGHDTRQWEGIIRVRWMLEAWIKAQELSQRTFNDGRQWDTIHGFDIENLGRLVEQEKNFGGFRKCDVFVGGHKCPAPSRISKLIQAWEEKQKERTPLENYRALLEIHPFVDGNGRTGKVLLNWLNGTLLDPIFPPSDFWGREIRNP